MTSTDQFVKELEYHVHERLASLDLLKEPEIGAVDRLEIVRRLKMALKNELEASEIAAVWIPSTPEIEVKLALARQVGDEAKHYKLIEDHLTKMGADLGGFNPSADGYGPMFQLLESFKTTVERIGAAQFTRESLALKKTSSSLSFARPPAIERLRSSIGKAYSPTKNGTSVSAARFSKSMQQPPSFRPRHAGRLKPFWVWR